MPPLVTDINLSLDDRFLYVSCWGTGELRQYDVSRSVQPALTGSVHIGGIVRRASHPTRPDEPLNGGPQMVEISRDGTRVYVTNSLYRRGTRSSTRTASRAGWPRSTRSRTAASTSIRLLPGVRRPAPAPGAPPGRRRVVRLVLLRVSGRRASRGRWRLLLRSAPSTASTRGWAGCSPSRSGCRSAAAARSGGAGAACARPRAGGRGRNRLALSAALCFPPAPCSGPSPRPARVRRVSASFRHAHPRWAGMRVGLNGFTLWSFLMASAHGAGLMVLPIFLRITHPRCRRMVPHCPGHGRHDVSRDNRDRLHATGYSAVTTIVAVVVFEKFGVGLLRKAWLNLDLLWAAAPIGTGVLKFLI